MSWRCLRRAPQISLLVPFRADAGATERLRNWRWLRAYWRHELPDAEIVMGHSRGYPFSKTEAVNDAARRARGRIFVILDSDCYIRGSIVEQCATRIEESTKRGHPLWFVPFRHLYRLTNVATERILASRPRQPLRLSSPPQSEDVESTLGSMHGHRFGAMIQILPREAFRLVGGMDPRFRGWGGEDIAFVRALDTLYGKHKTVRNDVLHLWHPNIGDTHDTRMWQGQRDPRANTQLASRYNQATGDRVRMRHLVHEGQVSVSWPRRLWEAILLLINCVFERSPRADGL